MELGDCREREREREGIGEVKQGKKRNERQGKKGMVSLSAESEQCGVNMPIFVISANYGAYGALRPILWPSATGIKDKRSGRDILSRTSCQELRGERGCVYV